MKTHLSLRPICVTASLLTLVTAPAALKTEDLPEEVRLADAARPAIWESVIQIDGVHGKRISLGVFETTSGRLLRTLWRGEAMPAGPITARWDGRDDRGRTVPDGSYEWRAVVTEGFTARYLGSVGINPPGGEHPVPSRSWAGDHVGAGLVEVDAGGVFIGSPMTENMMSLVRCDAAMSRVEWQREQFYDGGALRRVAAGGGKVFMLDPKGRLRRLDAASGKVEAQWEVADGQSVPADLDARGANLVSAWPEKNMVRWLSAENGKTVGETTLAGAARVTAAGEAAGSEALAASGRELFMVRPGTPPQKVATLDGEVTALDYDPARRELWVVLDGHRVARLDAAFQVVRTYGGERRKSGRFDPLRMAGVEDVEDVAADGAGGFFIGEPSVAPRRVARFAGDGSLAGQWFGGMSFYVNAAFDPDDATRIFGVAPEGSVSVWRFDGGRGSCTLEASYETGRLGDSLFPSTGGFRVVRKAGATFLYHRLMPAVLRLDEAAGAAVPVAVAGQVLNSGRNFFQFAGTGRDGYPKPWVAAAEHHGFGELARAPKLYSWADSDGDGEFDPAEFRFYPNPGASAALGNPGDYNAAGDFLFAGGINPKLAMTRLPVIGWEGPGGLAPRWDWERAESQGEILADPMGWGSPRGLSVAADGAVSVAWQAGLLVRDHGQYEGGGWPEQAVRGSRVLGFDARYRPLFAAGRQSKEPLEAGSGVLFYPMHTEAGPLQTVVVNDQTHQSPLVWTGDGLYAGSFFDHRAEDARDAGFYRTHGDDNQGLALATTRDGRTLWLAPCIGHNRLYEITGWNGWKRQQGVVKRPAPPQEPSPGWGLTARYFAGEKLALETVEVPIFHDPVGAEPHADRITAPYRAEWSGFIVPPLTDRYRFHALLGKDEQLVVRVDGRVVLAAGMAAPVSQKVELSALHRHRIRIEYENPSGRAELKLFWSSTVLDPSAIPPQLLHTED